VALVASNNPAAGGLDLAKTEGVATFTLSHKGMVRSEHDAAMEKAAIEAGAELIVLAGYMRILSDELAERWAGKMLNIHPSLLPKYKGLETHKRALEAGDSHAGTSVHLVVPELDAGAVLGQAKVVITEEDTPETLAERVKIAEHQLYPHVLRKFVTRESDPAYLLQRVEEIALALPETHARESHGSPGWRVGTEKSGKYFAYFLDQHHGSEHIAVLYYGASGWVGIILNRSNVDWDMVAQWIERSWASLAPKRLTLLHDAAAEF